ncbi:putative cadmium/zinc-transporting ATPase HMA4 [Sesamum angolense]|uniref:Cadmium/zinc-transporting ATPase HMA4 n=1 Tax=Sesamum angolense TaxID=2727404 RepID=A0AAE1WNM7_9LAMI|nr:putative cadmium/zinc-transporting ATPase HMA4 [Sesamum angolense]
MSNFLSKDIERVQPNHTRFLNSRRFNSLTVDIQWNSRRLEMEAIDKNVGKKFQKSYFDVLGLCCSSEIPLIERILSPLDGVKDFSVIVPTKTVIVVHDSLLISQIQIVKALNRARLEANVRVQSEPNYKNKWPRPYVVISGALLLLSFLKYVYSPLGWLAIGAVAVGVLPILSKAVLAIRNRTLDINVLVVIAAQWLESRASHKATAVMSSLVNVVPQRAVLAIQVKKSSRRSRLTRRSFPVAKEKDSLVWAGTVNLNGYITVKTTAVAEDSVVARMAKLVEDAQNKELKDLWTTILAIAAFLAIVPVAFRVKSKKEWYHLALVVLVSGCPCALVLSTPVAMFCALSKAARLGVLFKGAEHLESLARIKIMAFDKTGTITRQNFLCQISYPSRIMISSIESKSSHPMAAALIDFARAHAIEPEPEKVEKFQIFPGKGFMGELRIKTYTLETGKLLQEQGVPQKESLGYIFLGSSPAGIFCLSDACRTGAKEALEELKSMGIKTVMLTGDSYTAAKHAESQKEGPTAMTGDGVNDAPALSEAEVGISMGINGSALATETGDIVLMSNDIQRIPKALQKCCSAANDHGCDANCHLLHEAKVMDHQDLESEIVPMHDGYSSKASCCKENSCSRSAERHNDGLHDRVVEEQKFEQEGSSSSSYGCSEKVSCCKKNSCSKPAERCKNGGLYDITSPLEDFTNFRFARSPVFLNNEIVTEGGYKDRVCAWRLRRARVPSAMPIWNFGSDGRQN